MNVEIWSDVVCPWCYIGKRRFEAALSRFAHRDAVTITWRSFELDPQAPPRHPGTLDDLLQRKYGGSRAQVAQMHAQVAALAAAEGLEYRLDRAQPGNTFDAHRLLHLAADRDLQGALKERLLRAYFTEGAPTGDPETLLMLAADAGLDADEARAVLESGEYAEAVRDDEQRASDFGIRGVPFVAIDERYGVSGAQPAGAFLSALERAWVDAHPLGTLDAADDAALCEGDRCAVPAATPIAPR